MFCFIESISSFSRNGLSRSLRSPTPSRPEALPGASGSDSLVPGSRIKARRQGRPRGNLLATGKARRGRGPLSAPTWRAWPRPGPGSAGGRTFPLSKQTRVAGSPIALTLLGQVAEAQKERRLAEAGIERAPDDSLRCLTQGTLLERQHKYAEACTAFEQALGSRPSQTAQCESSA